MSSHQVVARQVHARFDESLRVNRKATIEPGCVRNSASHDEDVTDVARFGFSRPFIPPLHTLKMLVSFESDNFCARSQTDRRIFFDPSNQVARHARGQSLRAHQHMDVFGCLREKRRRLARGVSAANHNYFFLTA
jgi:hypothetical protein